MAVDVAQDAYGHLVFDYYHSDGSEEFREIIERDDGFIGFSTGPAAYFAPYEAWIVQEQQAIQYARGRVLDVGCGVGRVCLYLQEQNYEPVGIDNSPLSVRVAGERGVREAHVMSIRQVNKHELNHFDTIVMFGNNFGLFGNPIRARELLRHFYHMTPPDGIIIAESNDIYHTTAPYHLEYHKWNRQRGRLPGQLRLRLRYKKVIGPWFEYLMVSPDEMDQILIGTPWRIRELIKAESSGVYVAIIEKE